MAGFFVFQGTVLLYENCTVATVGSFLLQFWRDWFGRISTDFFPANIYLFKVNNLNEYSVFSSLARVHEVPI